VTARTLLLLAVTAPAVAGCVVGPDFRRPETPAPDRYTPEPLPERTASAPTEGGAAQRFVAAEDVPAQWWTLFRSEPLDRLVREALAQSPSLAAAEARLRQAQELLLAETGAVYYPAIAADAAVARQRRSVASLGIPGLSGGVFNLYNVSVSVSYALDTAGGLRRLIEALQAQVDFEAFRREAAYLTLAGNVVTAAVTEASLRAQIRATEEILAGIENQLAIAEKQLAIGAIARTDVLTQRAEAAQVRATLPALERRLAAVRHQLAVLLGRLPSAGDVPAFTLAALALPTELPLSLPSALVRQRPDVRAAEALLHAASAQIGVATANLYPQLTLSAAYGTEATDSDALFESNTRFWSIGASLLQPLFNGGELRARRRAAIAAFDAAAAQYRQTVLAAFQDVADVLRALETDARTLLEQQRAFAAAEEALGLVRRQYKVGAASYLQLLDAQRQFQQARIDLVQAQAARFADTAALFQALGGGWWNRPPAAVPVDAAAEVP